MFTLYHEKGQYLWPFEGDTSQRHYVLYELRSMHFFGQDLKSVFLLCLVVSRDLNQHLTHKKQSSSCSNNTNSKDHFHLLQRFEDTLT